MHEPRELVSMQLQVKGEHHPSLAKICGEALQRAGGKPPALIEFHRQYQPEIEPDFLRPLQAKLEERGRSGLIMGC